MRLARRAALALLAPALLLAVIGGIATARTLDMNEQTFRATWSELTFFTTETSVSCPATLEGTFIPESLGRTAKTAGNTIGRVTRASIGTCTGGTARPLTETLPWSVQYASFSGTLPNITGVTTNVIGAAFLIRPRTVEVSCLGRTEASHPIGVTFERNASAEITGARLNESLTIPVTGELFCSFSPPASVRGRASVTDAGSSNVLKIYLEEPPQDLGGRERGVLDDITMTEPVRIGQSSVKNYDQTDEIHGILVTKEGTSPGLFNLLSGTAEDCSTAGNRLRPRAGNMCTVRVEYIGTPGQRRAEMTVRIEFLIGNNMAREIERLFVIAER